MTTVKERQVWLHKRLADLNGRLAGIEAELDSPHDADWEDLATEREGDEVLERMGTSGQREIRMIEAALARIESGDYGMCTKCGAEIGKERLDVVPFTPFCPSCARTGRG
jgi:RNA polymerase-binding transcription factor DksA